MKMGKSRAARRKAAKRRAKLMKAQEQADREQRARSAHEHAQIARAWLDPAVEAENECQLCYYPMVPVDSDIGHVQQAKAQFPVWDWKQRGCECPEPKICLACIRHEAIRSGQRCCLEPTCHKIMVKCPWCRVPMNFGNLYYDWLCDGCHND